tara:strand:- start:794 stop:2203 length:1410 start_codon:yes stop_codon:yes gene_type:complete
MTLQSSGAISLSDIRDEYNTGSNAPIVFNDYYRGGSLVRGNAVNNTSTNLSADVPTSANNNPLSVEDFYGQGKGFRRTFNATATNQTGATMFGDDYTLDYPKEIVVDANVTVGATSTSNSAIQISSGLQGTISLTNNGSIEGAGGAASTQGGTALTCSSTVTVVNNGTIKGGGGGGGTGGAGGKGVFTGSATFSSLVDEGGGGSSSPQNNKPTWLNSIYTGAGNLDGVGVVGDRLWGGINAQFNRGINPAEFDINHSGSAGAGFSGACANRGPIYISAQTNLTGVYSVSASITTTYGSGYGTPTINVSTSNVTSGTSISNSGTVGIASGTTYYFTAYGSSSNNQNYYYNTLSMSVSGSPLVTQNGAAGGAGGVGEGYNQSAGAGASGSSGTNNAGSGGTGGTGGAFGQAGNAGGTGNNGSGTSVTYPATAPTNGASGANGGAAGLAVSGMSNVAGGSLGGSGTTVGGTA